MDIKEEIKKQIDSIPVEYLPLVQQYLNSLRDYQKKDKRIRTMHLKGTYDDRELKKICYDR
jgi:hypothetical protein